MRKLIWLVKRLGRLPGALLCLLIAGALMVCPRAQAQIIISNANDVVGLQNALISGNTNIFLQFSGTMTIITPFEIVENTVLDGTGFSPIISGGNTTQIFFVDPTVNFTMIDVTLSGANNLGATGPAGTTGGNGGSTGGNGGPGSGGTNSLGGAVHNEGSSTFLGCLFLTNAATGGAGGAGGHGGNGSNTGGRGGNGGNGGVGYGGAIYNIGTVLLSNCTVAGNTATGGAGGVGGTNGSGVFPSYPGAGGAGGLGAGAGIYNLGKLAIVNSTLNQNTSLGGASQKGGGPTGSSQNGGAGANGGNGEGGGVFNGGTNSLLNCTFFANVSTGGAGGNGGDGSTNGLSTGGTGGNGGNALGGGIYNAPGGIFAVTNCTFSGDVVNGGTNGVAGFGNFAGQNGSVGTTTGANINNGATLTNFLLRNTILAFPTNATSASGSITDQGNNISSDATPAFTTTNSFNSKDPKLSVTGLAANGSSSVLTIGLSTNSPAINAIYDGSAPPYDERGFIRPGQIRPCIGAFEFGSGFTNYDVTGTVSMGGLPLPGVTVTAGSVASTVTGTNGAFSFSLAPGTPIVIRPNPVGFFNPSSVSVNPSSNIFTTNFVATNAGIVFTNVTGTNTNTAFAPFLGIPNYAAYHIQATTNLSTNGTVWTNIAAFNTGGPTNVTPFGWFTANTNNNTNFFRVVIP
jgi:hypothetical protein